MTAQVTRIIKIEHPLTRAQLEQPALALRRGQLVAFPTETVYGLGANALDPKAVAEIFKVKGRPADNPLIVHVADLRDLASLVRGSLEIAGRLLAEFSPGPLTLVLPKRPHISDLVTAGLDTVAVRIPAHPTALKLIELAGVPVAAPSANRSGRPSPTMAWHVIDDLSGRIPYIIDDGSCQVGLESTVLDLSTDQPVILRPGAVTAEDIRARTGIQAVEILSGHAAASPQVPRSPGMKYRHYAPRAPLWLASGEDSQARARRIRLFFESLADPSQRRQLHLTDPEQILRVGLFACEKTRQLTGVSAELDAPVQIADAGATEVFRCLCYPFDYAKEPDPTAASSRLFAALRLFDRSGVDLIIAETLPDRAIGRAYMNRLEKAAGAGAQPEETS